jgi:hypothetical protein
MKLAPKLLALTFAVTTSLPAVARDPLVIDCTLETFSAKITRGRTAEDFDITLTMDGEAQISPVLSREKITRSKVESDEYYSQLLAAAGLEIDQILGATVYIADENVIGKSGLIVFTAGRGSMETVGGTYFATYSGYMEGCARE